MNTVRKRHVFFLAGFDPKGAAHYHGIYRRESQRQGAVTGRLYKVGPRQPLPGGNSAWQVEQLEGGARTRATIEYVRWDDIVRRHWPRSPGEILVAGLRGYAEALLCAGSLAKVWRTAPRTLVPFVYPAAFWLGSGMAGLALGALFASLWVLPAGPMAMAGLVSSMGLAAAIERRLHTSWLLRIYAFAAAWRKKRVGGLEARIDGLAANVAERLKDPSVDEVLVVGFSVGSLLAVSAVARVQAGATDPSSLHKLTLMTLGQCIPLLGLLPGAHSYRRELAQLASSPHVPWIDFSSVTDWGSFALVDPLVLCLGPAGDERAFAPRMLSPRFHTMFAPGEYQQIVRNKRRMHMQYLMSGQRSSAYDYFDITSGPRRLIDRVADATA